MDDQQLSLLFRRHAIINAVMLVDVMVATLAGFHWPLAHWLAAPLALAALIINGVSYRRLSFHEAHTLLRVLIALNALCLFFAATTVLSSGWPPAMAG